MNEDIVAYLINSDDCRVENLLEGVYGTAEIPDKTDLKGILDSYTCGWEVECYIDKTSIWPDYAKNYSGQDPVKLDQMSNGMLYRYFKNHRQKAEEIDDYVKNAARDQSYAFDGEISLFAYDGIIKKAGGMAKLIQTVGLIPYYKPDGDIYYARDTRGGIDYNNKAQLRKQLASKIVREEGIDLESAGMDASLYEHPSADDYLDVEFGSEPMDGGKALDHLMQMLLFVDKHGHTDNRCGLHFSFSPKGKINYLKLALLLGEKGIAREYGRENNGHANSRIRGMLSTLRRYYNAEAMKSLLDMLRAGKDIDAEVAKIDVMDVTDKYWVFRHRTSDHDEAPDTLEFRVIGGRDYQKKTKQITEHILRMAWTLDVACNRDAMREEYLKRLAALFQTAYDALPKKDTKSIRELAGTKWSAVARLSNGKSEYYDYKQKAWIKFDTGDKLSADTAMSVRDIQANLDELRAKQGRMIVLHGLDGRMYTTSSFTTFDAKRK